MKYLMHKTLGPILFNNDVSHEALARWLGGKDDVVSAGFYSCNPVAGRTFGVSNTLNRTPDEEDAKIIEANLTT